MGTESIPSASAVVSNLDTQSQTVINNVFIDTVNGNVTNTSLIAGNLLTGTGSGGTVQGAIVGNGSGSSVVTSLTLGGSSTGVTVPGGKGAVFAFESTPTTVTGSQAGLIVSDLATKNYGTTILGGSGTGVVDNGVGLANKLITSGSLGNSTISGVGVNVVYAGAGNDTVVASSGNDTILGGSGNNVIGLNHTGSHYDVLSNTGSNSVIFSSNASTIFAAGGNSTVVSSNNNGVVIGTDKGNNLVIAGSGADTIFASGGRDTLTGGAGNDLFIFNAVGHYTLTDFNPSGDKLMFNLPNVTNAGGLTPWITSTANVNGNAVLSFGTEASITVVGISVDNLLALLNNANFIAL